MLLRLLLPPFQGKSLYFVNAHYKSGDRDRFVQNLGQSLQDWIIYLLQVPNIAGGRRQEAGGRR
nr:hypothetical protein [Nostoc sp. ChiSLP03a]